MTGPEPAATSPRARRPSRLARGLRRLGRSLYLLIVQTLVGLAALALFVYFAVNSPSAATRLSKLVTAVLPGSLQIEALRWGPAPGHLVVRGLQVQAPTGQVVLAVARAELDVAVVRLLDSLYGGKGVVLAVDEADVRGADVRLENDAQGRLLLTQAFVDPDQPEDDTPGKPFRLDIRQLRATDAAFVLNSPAIYLQATGGDLAGAFQLHTVPDQPPEVAWQLSGVSVREATTRIGALRDLPPLPTATAWTGPVVGDLHHVRVSGLRAQTPAVGAWYEAALPDTVLWDARIGVTLQPHVEVEGRHLQLATSTASTFLGPMLGTSFDAEALAHGDFRVDRRGGFSSQVEVLGRGRTSGFDTERIAGRVEVETGQPGANLVRVDARDVVVQAYGGELSSAHVIYRLLHEDKSHHVAGRFTVRDVLPADVLHAPAVGLEGAVPLAVQGRLSGEVGAALRFADTRAARPEDLQPGQVRGLDLDVAVDTDLVLDRHGVAAPLTAQLPRLHLQGGVLYAMGGARGPLLELDQVLLHTAETAQAAERLGRHEWIRASGRLDFGRADTDLRVTAYVPRLEHLLGPLGVPGVGGQLTLSEVRLRGTMKVPEIAGDLRARNLYGKGHQVPRLDTRVRLSQGVLHLDRLRATTDLGQVQADVELGLFGPTLQEPRRRRTLHVRHLTLDGVDLGKTLAAFGMPGISGRAAIARGDVQLDLAAPVRTLRVMGDVTARDVGLGGERFPAIDAHVHMDGRRILVPDLAVVLPGGETARATVAYDLGAGRYEASVALPPLDLGALQALQFDAFTLGGAVGGKLQVQGTAREIALHGELELRDMTYYSEAQKLDVRLGTATLVVDKTADGPAVLRSDKFFPRFRLREGSAITFRGMKPEQLLLEIATAVPVDPFQIAGMERPAGIKVRFDGQVATRVDFRPEGARPADALPWRVDVDVPPGGIVVDLGGGLQMLRNTSPTTVEVLPTEVRIGSSFFDLGRHALELCGQFRYADKDSGTPASLLGFLSGTVDVPRVGVLSQFLAGMDLRFDILGDALVAGDPRSACLTSSAKGRMRLEGPLDDLRVQGTLQTRSSRISVRRFPDILLAEGGRLQVSSGAGGRMTVTIPRNHQLVGTMDEGRFALFGQALLIAGALETLDFTLEGADIPYAAAKEYSVVVSPALRLKGSELGDPDRRSVVLSGVVDVPEAAYFKSFDKVATVVGGVRERQVQTFTKPVRESMPWLCEVQLDLRVRTNNAEFTSRFPLLKADLLLEADLKVLGSICDMRVHDRAKVVEGSGSTITYAINNLVFEVERGSADFNGDMLRPYLDFVLKADIPLTNAGAGARSTAGLGQDLVLETAQSSEVVTVTVQISGIYGDPTRNFDIRFSSNKGDSQADVQYLILMGRRTTDERGAPLRLNTDLLLGGALDQGSSLLLKPVKAVLDLVADKLTVDVDPNSRGITVEAAKNLGKDFSAAVKVETGFASKYTASFVWRLSERLSANGLWRRQQSVDTGTALQDPDVYEAKLRFKVPLKD